MNWADFRRLARSGDAGPAAVSLRLRAARLASGTGQWQVAQWRHWVGHDALAHVEAAEAGAVEPNISLLNYFWFHLELTEAFFETGDIEDVRPGVATRLFAELTKLSLC